MAAAPEQENLMFTETTDGLALPYTDEPITFPLLLALGLKTETITTLNLPPIPATDLAILMPLIHKRMPFLEELSIACDNPFPFDPLCSPGKFPLLASHFPSLKTLRVSGLAVSMASNFIPTLRHLELKDYTGEECYLLLPEFMAAMEGCLELETLEIRNYGRIFSTDTERPERPAILRSLRKLVIEDSPAVLSLLTTFLYVPPTADVHLIVDMADTSREYDYDFGDTFAYVLPDDTRTLPLLPEITAIEVNLIENTYQFVGETPLHNKLIIDIDMDAVIKESSPTKRAELFDSTVRNLGLALHDSPVMVASLTGDLSGVTRESWHRGLRGLPRLMKLQVVDTGTNGGDGMRAFFEALASPLEATDEKQKIVCLSLDAVAVRGATYSRSLMEEIGKCLRRRAEEGVEVQSLWVELRSEDALDRAELAKVQTEFSEFVDACFVGVPE
ncbi:hypothetical protein C8Q73DRAFT_324077 [Cubamyces lactineus]|nr:hypothetical protein C8Q73DRAFT_324077 [Cubamyces lactineus]